jgi:hypothetical protein
MKKNASKKPSAAGRESDRWLDWEDGMMIHCRALITLAELLMQSDERGLEAQLVGDAGALILREAEQLKKLVSARPKRNAAR